MLSTTRDPSRVVLSAPGPAGSGRPGSVRVLTDGTDASSTRVTAAGAGYLVVADADQQHWVATVDGRPAPLVPADHALVAVPVPAGTHTVALAYRPPGQALGAAVSVGSALLLVLAATGSGVLRRRRTRAGPPAYYLLMAPALDVVPHWADQPFDRVVSWLRAVNALLLLPLPLLGYALARKVGLAEPVAVAAAAGPLAVPQLYHIGSSVNNDNLLLPLLAATSVVAAGVGRGDVRRRTAVGLGLLVGACLLTKGFGLFLPLLVGLAYLVGATRAGLRRAVLPALLAEAVGLGTGGWWWIHNKIAYGVVQPDGTKTVQPDLVAHTSFGRTGPTWLRMFAELMNRRFWLDPGATQLPRVAAAAAVLGAVLVGAGVLLSLVLGRPARRDALLLAVPFCCLAGIVAWGSWDVWEKVISPAGMQGRYLYGGLPGIAVLAVGGAGRYLRRRTPLVVLGLAGLAQLLGLWLALRVYWLPPTGFPPRRLSAAGHNLLAWSAWPPVLVLVLFAGLAAAGVLAAHAAWRTARTEPGEPTAPAAGGEPAAPGVS